MTIISKTEDLLILLAVYDTGSFSGAAKTLDCPVAKITRAVQRLEQELNTTLFNRTTRKVKATEEGCLFVEQIRPGLTQIEQAEEDLRMLKNEPSGLLRVDAASPFILHQLVPLMADFQIAYPLIRTELISNENIIDLIEKRTDVAIRIGTLNDSNLHSRKLGISRLRIVGSPSYFTTYGHPEVISDLSHHKILLFSGNSKLNNWPLAETIKLKSSLTASSGETQLKLCLAGHGLALLSDFMTKHLRENGELEETLAGSVLHPNHRETVSAVYYRNTALSGRISAFIDFIADKLDL